MTHLRMVLIGFGNVGKAFARLLLRKRDLLARDYGLTFQVNGITTGRHGRAIDPAGLDLARAVEVLEQGGNLDVLSAQPAPADTLEFIRACPADVLFENTPVNHHTGQPAIDYLRAGLEAGMHAVTANKGPVVHGYDLLTRLAAEKGRRFLFESAVMDGAPIFSLFRGPLPAAELRGFVGILNSCTNLLLELMEQGSSFDEAVAYGKSIGITETDPSADIDGWDAAIKVAALATVVMGEPLKPQDVLREGIRGITPEMLKEALADGQRWKLVCSARHEEGKLVGRVEPQRVSAGSPLYSISGTSSYVQFELDTLPGLGIVESDPGPETTAYGLLADVINAVRGM
ncbi:MAG: homoserine dehydrogenase [Anaerolineaceae bacterium]|nr:homoserine dehydrogenase [Anaerolineaceae bacterium]